MLKANINCSVVFFEDYIPKEDANKIKGIFLLIKPSLKVSSQGAATGHVQSPPPTGRNYILV
jgi:hypothetical protein